MKKVKVLTLGAVLLLSVFFVSIVTAEEMKSQMDMKQGNMMDKSDTMDKGGMTGGGMMKGDMMGKGMMGGKMMGMMGNMEMHGMMMRMMEKSVVATSDGGVIVVMGNKMTKYDKDLNVVKEVEMKMDMDAMKKNMDDMMKMCPMMGKGMKDGMSKKDDDNDDDAAEAAEKAEHESHHPENK